MTGILIIHRFVLGYIILGYIKVMRFFKRRDLLYLM